MITVSDMIEDLGKTDICRVLGVGETALLNARKNNTFPTSWYLPLKSLARKKRKRLPDDLFKWRGEVTA